MKKHLKNKRVLVTVMLFIISTLSYAAEERPKELQDIGITNPLGKQISLDLTFQEASGERSPLQKYFQKEKPVILSFAYYKCPSLCTLLLNGKTEALKKVKWDIGNQFEVVTVSIDSRETPDLAAAKKKTYLDHYDREGSEKGWHFLVGEQSEVRQLAGEIGFQYKYDAETDQFAHPAALFLMTPEGKVARMLSGIEFSPRDLRLGLVEASQGKVGNVVDRLLLYCYRYDPKTNQYTLFATNLMKGGGAATILFLGFLIYGLGRGEKKQ